jgi:septation ring formation regulator EzrA
MKRSLSQYRLITGLKSHRPNPILINKQSPAMIQAALPEVVETTFNAEDFDKDYAFNCTQHRWFHKQLHHGEEVIMTADQLKMICDEVHEMGRLRETSLSKIGKPRQRLEYAH